MIVISLKAENFLRLRAVEITPTGELVKVSGANAQGKTSVLDSIWAALDHRRVGAVQSVRKGAKKATIKLDLGEIKVERTITAKSTELTVTQADGLNIKSPQKFLDALIGELSFDPLAFERMKATDQVEMLRRAVKSDFDFVANARARQTAFDQRTEVTRRAKEKRARADGIVYAPGLPAEKIDTKAMLDRMESAAAHNASIEARRVKRQSVEQEAAACAGQIVRNCDRITKLREEIDALMAENIELNARESAARERLNSAKPLPQPIDVAAVRGELDAAEGINKEIDLRLQAGATEAEATELEAEVVTLTDHIDALDDAKRQAIASANLPVEGLDLGDDMVLYNGLPFAQASSAERLRISMGLAMAANPSIRVLRIADGSLLDSMSMAIVGEMAKANDFQVWVEVVDESKGVGIVIEDGMVAAVNA